MNTSTTNNNSNKPTTDDVSKVVDGKTLVTLDARAHVFNPSNLSYMNESMTKVFQTLEGELIAGPTKVYIPFVLIGYLLACLLVGMDKNKCLMTPNSYYKHLARVHSKPNLGNSCIGCKYMLLFYV